MYYPESLYFIKVFVPLFLLALGLFITALAIAFKSPVTMVMMLCVVIGVGYFYMGWGSMRRMPPDALYIMGYGLIAIVVCKLFSGG